MSNAPSMQPASAADDAKLAVEIWKKVVDVQQHFNDIELRIRNLAITVLVAALGASGYALKEQQQFLAMALVFAGVIGWLAFFLMDAYWYHRFLKAAAAHGAEIERRWQATLPELSLATMISAASPVNVPLRKVPITSTTKIHLFYGVGFVVLFAAFWFAYIYQPPPPPNAKPDCAAVQPCQVTVTVPDRGQSAQPQADPPASVRPAPAAQPSPGQKRPAVPPPSSPRSPSPPKG